MSFRIVINTSRLQNMNGVGENIGMTMDIELGLMKK